MEEALRHYEIDTVGSRQISFNPCFNGRGVKTKNEQRLLRLRTGFNPCFNGRGVKTTSAETVQPGLQLVSILVLMEEALRRKKQALSH